MRRLRALKICREAPVRFGSATVWGWNGSSGSGFRFRRFLCKKGFFFVFQYSLTGKDGSGSGFGSWKTVPAVPVPLSVSCENGSDGSGFRFRFGSWATLKSDSFTAVVLEQVTQAEQTGSRHLQHLQAGICPNSCSRSVLSWASPM